MTIRDFRSKAMVLCVFLATYGLSHSTAVLAQPEPSKDDLRSVRARYEADQWPKGVLRDGFPLGSLELEGWKGGALRSDAGYMQRKFLASGKSDQAQAIVIDALVGDSVEQAQQRLLIWLAGRQSPDAAPRAEDRNLKVGDVGYLGLSGAQGQNIASVAFVRGNIAVRVRNANPRLHPDLDLGGLARTLDEKISSRDPLAETEKPQPPRIEKLSSDKQEVTAGDVVRLDVAVSDPARGTPNFHWVVGGAGQGYVEANDDNIWYLHTTKAGMISLSLEVTASTGTFTAKEIKVMVLPVRKG